MSETTRERNGNWKGGRSVASNGYVLVRVGASHHLGDVRGYAYEHRLVAEEKIGRRLMPGEQVHHLNGNKQDNRPENIEVMNSLAHHLNKHRKVHSGRRLADERNLAVLCACGCGKRFKKFDSAGRPRRFISGHNPQNKAKRIAVLAMALEKGAVTPCSVTPLLASRRAARVLLSRLFNTGHLIRTGHGVYGPINH